MKRLFLGTAFVLLAGAASAQTPDHYVNGYTRSNGTYVAPHYQTNPNYTRSDNYSTVGNVNPYTGQIGTKPSGLNYGYQTPYGGGASNPYAVQAPKICVYGQVC